MHLPANKQVKVLSPFFLQITKRLHLPARLGTARALREAGVYGARTSAGPASELVRQAQFPFSCIQCSQRDLHTSTMTGRTKCLAQTPEGILSPGAPMAMWGHLTDALNQRSPHAGTSQFSDPGCREPGLHQTCGRSIGKAMVDRVAICRGQRSREQTAACGLALITRCRQGLREVIAASEFQALRSPPTPPDLQMCMINVYLHWSAVSHLAPAFPVLCLCVFLHPPRLPAG